VTDRPYVDLREAVRVLVRLMQSDGELLAEKMADEWIVGGYLRWNSDNYPDDDPSMIRQYGLEWRVMRQRVVDAYGRAIRVLEKLLASGRVRGVGVSAAGRDIGQRLIEAHEWASHQLEIRRNLLATPTRKEPERLPPILDVLVSAEDLKRECAAMLASETLAAPDLESMLRELRLKNPNLTQTAAEKIARERGALGRRQQFRDLWKTLGGSSKPGPRGPRKNRAAHLA
jgi:hypothetical protein